MARSPESNYFKDAARAATDFLEQLIADDPLYVDIPSLFVEERFEEESD